MKRIAAFVIPLLLLSWAGGANSALIQFESSIDGAQANAGAGTGSPGTGSATVTFDDVTNDLSWNISWSGLLAGVTVAHFHGPALPSQNAGVQVDFLTIANGNPSIGMTTITADQSAQLLDELWYINIHTEAFPAGEIRGQVRRVGAVPLPSTLALVLAAGLLLRRKTTT